MGRIGQIPWNKGKKDILTPEQKQKISQTLKRKFANGEIKKLVGKDNPHFGKSPWNKGKIGVYSDETRRKISEAQIGSKRNLGVPKSEEHKMKLSLANLGKKSPLKGVPYREGRIHPRGMAGKTLSKESREKISQKNKGKNVSLETRRKLSENNKGEKCRFWKGGVYKFRDHLRDNFEYRQWRSDVFTRDDFTCQKCFVRGGQLHAHHIKHFSKIIEDNNIQSLEEAKVCQELWNINNGITLCETCHKQEHKKVL
jgi:5-methylcytosine-specific restriction endonuclease McrA